MRKHYRAPRHAKAGEPLRDVIQSAVDKVQYKGGFWLLLEQAPIT
jgi:hypothetical protein